MRLPMRGSNVNELQPFRLPLHGMVFLGDQALACLWTPVFVSLNAKPSTAAAVL